MQKNQDSISEEEQDLDLLPAPNGQVKPLKVTWPLVRPT